MLVCTLGDLHLDVVALLEQPIVTGGDASARTTVTAGGQAANVAAWVVALGGRARLIAKRADDDAGTLAAAALRRLGVELAGPVVTEGTGVVVSLVTPDGERSMISDRGVSAGLCADEIDRGWFVGCRHLHVSGYCLANEPGRSAAVCAVGLARAAGAAVSLDLAASSVIEAVGANELREFVDALGPDTVFCNEDEDRAIGGAVSGTMWILKRGARGACFDGTEKPAAPGKAVDSTGAGDALAAGWLVGGPDLALEAAARCIGTVGAMPAG
jgi:ribokinase